MKNVGKTGRGSKTQNKKMDEKEGERNEEDKEGERGGKTQGEDHREEDEERRWGMKKDRSLYATARLVGARERRRTDGGGRRMNR